MAVVGREQENRRLFSNPRCNSHISHFALQYSAFGVRSWRSRSLFLAVPKAHACCPVDPCPYADDTASGYECTGLGPDRPHRSDRVLIALSPLPPRGYVYKAFWRLLPFVNPVLQHLRIAHVRFSQ